MLQTLLNALTATCAWLSTTLPHSLDYLWSAVQPRFYRNFRARADSRLRHDLRNAKTYEEWLSKAQELDALKGNETWKNDPASHHYDYRLISYRLRHLRAQKNRNDLPGMLTSFQSGLSRNLGGYTDLRLFTRCYTGTKKQVEEYNEELVAHLKNIASRDFGEGSSITKRTFFVGTRRGFGRTALILQGGATFGLSHVGVCKALFENGLLPTIICGSAVGALIAALVCIHTNEELPTVFTSGGIDLTAFANKQPSGHMKRKLDRLLRHGYLMDVKVIEDCVRSNIGDMTFEEAYYRTGRILNITVSPERRNEVPQLLNYLTAPNVLIWSAACASAATFGLYESVSLLAKNHAGNVVNWSPNDIRWNESANEGDNPVNRLSELFTVNHLIVSQANAYIASICRQTSCSSKHSFLRKVVHIFLSECSAAIRFFIPQFFTGVLDDRFHGNVTIIPKFEVKDGKFMFSNPTQDVVDYWILKGEQSTWPKMSLIQNRCLVEFTLDEIIEAMPEKKILYPDIEAEYSTSTISGNQQKAVKRAKSIH